MTRCYLCDWEGEASHCGLLDCPRKIAAPQMPVSARTGDTPVADGTSGRSLAPSAGAAPLTAEQIAFNEVGLDDDPWYRKAAHEFWRGERRR